MKSWWCPVTTPPSSPAWPSPTPWWPPEATRWWPFRPTAPPGPGALTMSIPARSPCPALTP